MHDGWPYVASAYTLIFATLGLWFAMIVRRFVLVRADLVEAEREVAAASAARGASVPDA